MKPFEKANWLLLLAVLLVNVIYTASTLFGHGSTETMLTIIHTNSVLTLGWAFGACFRRK